jgi:hypothetical protein
LSLESKCRPIGTRSKETRQANSKSYKNSLIAKSSQNDTKKKEQEGKEPVFLKLMNTPIVTFGRTQTFLPLLFSVYLRTGVFAKLTHFHKSNQKEKNIIKRRSKWISEILTFCNCC